MRRFLFFMSFVLSTTAIAGGDYTLGQLSSFSEENGTYNFHFVQTDSGSLLIEGCKEFDVSVSYFPLRRSPTVSREFPSEEQTLEAAAFMKKAFLEKRDVYFGYMGRGLIRSGKSCSFLSRALLLEYQTEQQIVLAFYHPV